MFVVLEENLYFIEPELKVVTETREKAEEWIAIKESSLKYNSLLSQYYIKEVILYK